MVKPRPLMYKKKCENTFEILRSEITFLMDLCIMIKVIQCKMCCVYRLLINHD